MKTSIFAILGIFAFSVSILSMVLPFSSLERSPAQYRSPSIPENQKLNFKDFSRILIESNAQTISELLSKLSSTHPQYLKSFVAMYESESLQKASFQSPRIVVFGPEAKFVFTFNGGPHQIGGNTIETASFNEDTSQFEFREIVFLKEGDQKSHFLDENEIELQTKNLIISKANPVKCAECHGFVIATPIWDNYFIWPGAYGSNDDLLFNTTSQNHRDHGGYEYLNKLSFPRSQGRTVDLKPNTEDIELSQFTELRKNAPGHDRYKWFSFDKFSGTDPKIGDRPNSDLMNRLQDLAENHLLREVQRRNLKAKWGDIAWDRLAPEKGSFEAKTGAQILNDLNDSFVRVIGEERHRNLIKSQGSFKDYLSRVLVKELEMQKTKFLRMEMAIGKKSLRISPLWIKDSYRTRLPRHVYKTLLEREFDDYEEMAYQIESSDLVTIAALSYLLRGEGIQLSDYEINRRRVLSFHTFSLKKTAKYLGLQFSRGH